MQLSVSPVPLPISVPGLHFNWLYCIRGPVVACPQAPALAALIEHAHTIALQERAVILRLEPNIAYDDPDIDTWLEAYRTLGFRTNPSSCMGGEAGYWIFARI